LAPLIQMCDALSRNAPRLTAGVRVLLAFCLAHGRRQFVDVAGNFPDQCRYVLEKLGSVWHHDQLARERRLTPEQRLLFHREHSGPVMTALKEWMETQLDARMVEPNSGLGKAVQYMLRHWTELTLFLREVGAPLDNNIVERMLKKAILHRNWVRVTDRSACQAGGPRIHFVRTAGVNISRWHRHIISETFQEPK
jgi:hypothetical protein